MLSESLQPASKFVGILKLLSCVTGGVTAPNKNEHNEKSLFFMFMFCSLKRLFKMCFIPQFAACFAPQDQSNIHYQINVLGISGFPVIGWYFIKKISWACCYLVNSIAFKNTTHIF